MVAGRMIVSEAKENGYFEDYQPEIEFQYTVLFYVNTLFSAMPKKYKIKGCYNFCKDLGKEMKETFPDFQNNPYYIEKIHPEEKKLIGYQMKSHLFFYIYYRLLLTTTRFATFIHLNDIRNNKCIRIYPSPIFSIAFSQSDNSLSLADIPFE